MFPIRTGVYKGTVPYSHPIELVDEFPATGLVGTLYVNTSTKEGKAWNGSAWVTVQLAVSTTLDDSDEAIPTSKAVKEYVDGAVENIVAGGGAVTDVTYADKTITVKKRDEFHDAASAHRAGRRGII